MTDKTPLGKLIEWLVSSSEGVEDSSLGSVYSQSLIDAANYAKSLLPEEKQAMEDAITSEAAREYWEEKIISENTPVKLPAPPNQ